MKKYTTPDTAVLDLRLTGDLLQWALSDSGTMGEGGMPQRHHPLMR